MSRSLGIPRREEIRNSDGTLHLTRWRIIDSPLGGIRVHRFTSADDGLLHDHPWNFISLVWGGYVENTPSGSRRVRWVNRKRATDTHSIAELLTTPTWTLVVTGVRRRAWGFRR